MAHGPWRGGTRRLDGLLLFIASLCAGVPVAAQTMASTGNLSFGSFAAMPGSTGGTVAVAPDSSRSAPSGGVMLVGNAGVSAANFTVSGTPGTTYSISLPQNNTVFLSDDNGHSMAINGFVSSPDATGILSGGSQMLSVGATLTIDNRQLPGNYSGSFSVTVNYP